MAGLRLLEEKSLEYPIFFVSRSVAASVFFFSLLPSISLFSKAKSPGRRLKQAFKCIQLIFDSKKSRSTLPQVRLLFYFQLWSKPGDSHLEMRCCKLSSQEITEIFLRSNSVKSFAQCEIRTADP